MYNLLTICPTDKRYLQKLLDYIILNNYISENLRLPAQICVGCFTSLQPKITHTRKLLFHQSTKIISN